jgi:hypothetical protein
MWNRKLWIPFKEEVCIGDLGHSRKKSESRNGKLLYHADVCWLSMAKFLLRYRDLLQEVKEVLMSRSEECVHLDRQDWPMDLAFRVDIVTCIYLNGQPLVLPSTQTTTGSILDSWSYLDPSGSLNCKARDKFMLIEDLRIGHWPSVFFSWAMHSRELQPFSVVHRQGHQILHHWPQVGPQPSFSWDLSFVKGKSFLLGPLLASQIKCSTWWEGY